MKWGNGAIVENEWKIINSFVTEYDVKSVIEYGYGVSTTLFYFIGTNIVTYESNPGWFIKGIAAGYNLVMWDACSMLPLRKADMVFIDGPLGDREWSFKNAVLQSDLIVVHDAGRERKLRTKYLSNYKKLAGDGRLVICRKENNV